MAITRFKASSIKTGEKYVSFDGGLPNTPTIGAATDGGTGTSALVAFTANNTAGLTYTALSNPDSLTASSTLSPITVTGLTTGTAYTFTVKATNSAGDSPASAASNSVTPVSPSSYESIATLTPSSGTTVSFTSIPATYKHLQIRGVARSTTNTSSFAIRFNSDTTNNYAAHWLYGDGTGAFASGSAPRSNIWVQGYFPGTGVNSSIVCATIIDVHDYASTTKNKTVRSFNGLMTDTNFDNYVNLVSGVWLNTNAITSINITFNGETIGAGSTFSLYGIRG